MERDALSIILKTKVVAIIRKLDYERAIKTIDCLYKNGVTVFEVTLNTNQAFDIIRYAKDTYGDKILVGVGTVLDKDGVLNAINAGAEFILTPNLYEEVVSACMENRILVIPGVLTPTEIANACRLGCKMVKIFPITSMADNYINQVTAPLDSIKIMAVGGINNDNVLKYLNGGADCVGVGYLADSKLINSDNFYELGKRILDFVNKIN